jgi:hypothetical protein
MDEMKRPGGLTAFNADSVEYGFQEKHGSLRGWEALIIVSANTVAVGHKCCPVGAASRRDHK